MSTEKIPERKDVPPSDRWDLARLFDNENQWEELFRELEQSIDRYSEYRGRLAESVDLFTEALEFDLRVSRNIEKLYVYAHLKSDEDTANQVYLGLYQRAMNLYRRISEASSYLTPEIQSIPDDRMEGYIADSRLKQYTFFLEKILRFKPHTLSDEIEMILAMSGEVSQAASQVFSQLNNADLRFGSLENEKGVELELSHGNFSTFLMSSSREVRDKAFFQYYQSYREHKNTIATSLAYSVRKDVFYSRVRKFESSRKGALFSDDVQEQVYDNLIDAVKMNLSPLFKYLDFRKQVLGLDELHFYDTYVPLVDEITFSKSYEESVETCVRALAPLGDEYTGILEKGLMEGWVDRYENRGKRSGAYSSGCYDSPPYILLNYKSDNINSLYTLIHEAGHSMHSYLSIQNQPYHYHDYTIFVAEVASTFNEALLSSRLMKENRDDPRMRAYIINREIDNIRGTLIRQTMFAEFEKITHELAEENKPLTLEVFQEIYRGLLKDYFGDAMVIDEELTLECLRIPHFYSAFYVYKYATGISAAIALARKVLGGDREARDRYLDFLTLGGSMFPLDELKTAGVDMTKPEPVEKALHHFSTLVDDLIETYESF